MVGSLGRLGAARPLRHDGRVAASPLPPWPAVPPAHGRVTLRAVEASDVELARELSTCDAARGGGVRRRARAGAVDRPLRPADRLAAPARHGRGGTRLGAPAAAAARGGRRLLLHRRRLRDGYARGPLRPVAARAGAGAG